MAIPRADGTIAARVKVLEDKVRRIQLMPSLSQSAVEPLAVKGAGWYDSSAGNEPKVFDGTNWVPVRDETIAVAQTAADTAQSTATAAASDAAQAASDAAAAQAATVALQTDLDAAEAAVTAAQADINTLNGTTIPALQSDLSAAEANITTLTGTTIPGLTSDIAATQADVDAILPITTTDISDDAITTPKIAAGQITAVKIAADTITATEIAANAITASELAANAVIAGKIAAGTIVAADIAANTITATQIAANTITAAQIAAGTITATEIQAGAVTAAKLSASAIDGKTITGTLLRTAASGQRIEVDSAGDGSINFYSGEPGEVNPARVRSVSSPGQISVRLDSGNFLGGAPSSLTVFINNGGDGQIDGDASLITWTASSRIDLNAPAVQATASSRIDLNSPAVQVNGANVMVVGGNPQPVFVSDATGTGSVAITTTYAAGSPVVGATFIAPASGKVYITVGGRIENGTATNTTYLSYEVRTGATVGSGSVVLAADSGGRSLAAGTTASARAGGSRRYLLTALSPGIAYNVRTMHAGQIAGNSTFFNRELLVEPVL